MDLNEKVKWEFITNNVKDRMIESSLVHKFSKSKKYAKSTKLLNKWVENHRKFSYMDYVKVKRSIKKSLSKDRIIKDDDSYGEEDYLIAHKKNLYKTKIKSNRTKIKSNRTKISNNKDISTSTPIKTIQKEKEILFTDSDSSETSIKNISLESSILQDKDDSINTKSISDIHNADTIPVVEINQSVSSPEQYFTPIKKTQLIDNEEKRFVNNTDISSAIVKKRKKSKKASLSHKRNNSFTNGERTSEETLDLISDEEEILDLISDEEEILDLISDEEEILDLISDEEEILDLISDEEEITTCHSNTSHNNINSYAVEIQRSPIIISSTDISNNKYKIINKKESCRYLWNEYNDVSFNKEKEEELEEKKEELEEKKEELEENVIFVENTNSSSILPLSEKRLNQIKRLNLAVESSSSEDEVQERKENLNEEILANNSNCITTKTITTSNKNLSSTIESSLNQDEIIELTENINKKNLPNNSNCIIDKTITTCNKNFDLTIKSTLSEDELLKSTFSEDELLKSTFSEDEMLKKQDSNEKINNSNSVASKKTIQSKLKLKKSSKADHKKDQSIFNIQSKNNSINHNDSIDHHSNDSQNCEQIQRFNGISCNLQDFIDKENLVHDSTKSTFTLEDLSQDNEIFLLNIPSTVKLTDLKGQKIVLKNEKLKLGKNQYRISYKDVPSQSCVFSTHKNNKSYKLVNIKPTSSILVREKLSP